jgi:hypothetical protein
VFKKFIESAAIISAFIDASQKMLAVTSQLHVIARDEAISPYAARGMLRKKYLQ